MDSEKLEQAAELLHNIAEAEHAEEAQAEKPSAAECLRAFEDKVLGADVPRVDGKVELGHGSKYRDMKPEDRERHDALVRLVAAEDRVTKATAELTEAKADHAQAIAKAGV